MNNYYTHYRPLNINEAKAFTGVAASCAAVSAQTYAVTLTASTDCYVNFGGTASATAGHFLQADIPYTFTCHPSEVISVIQKAAGGTLEVSQLTR
jgi:hypothetical protein